MPHRGATKLLVLAILPALLAAKGCYFGAEDVPLGGNYDHDAGGEGAGDTMGIGPEVGGGASTGAGANADAGDTAGQGGAGGTDGGITRPVRDPGVFLIQ